MRMTGFVQVHPHLGARLTNTLVADTGHFLDEITAQVADRPRSHDRLLTRHRLQVRHDTFYVFSRYGVCG